MKRNILTVSKTFRLTVSLNRELAGLADTANRHQSQLIRDAVEQYVAYFRDHPEELAKALKP
jgi:predicted transcriptional regulator